jgi:hypothetical protein
VSYVFHEVPGLRAYKLFICGGVQALPVPAVWRRPAGQAFTILPRKNVTTLDFECGYRLNHFSRRSSLCGLLFHYYL